MQLDKFNSPKSYSISEIQSIDCMRGWAILLVILVHASALVHGPDFFAIGKRGVQLFYILSAFTLMISHTIG